MPPTAPTAQEHTATPPQAGLPAPGGGRSAGRGAPRLYALDGLRLVAALMVVAYHYMAYGANSDVTGWGGDPADHFPAPVSAAASYGFLGVELFFLISGFVICMSCWGRSPKEFLVSRVTRLFPAYWLAILVTTAVMNIAPVVYDPPELTLVLSNLTMFQEAFNVGHIDGVYWSLWAELRFYLIFGIVVAMGTTYQRVLLFCGIWAVASVLSDQAELPLLDLLAQPRYAPFFIAGVVMYLMHRFRPNPMLWGLLIFCWLVAQHRTWALINQAQESLSHQLSWEVALGFVTAFFLLVLLVALGKLDFVRWGWLTTAGAITYPLYLLHENIGWTVIHVLSDRVPSWAIVAGLVPALMLLSWLVHRLVERPVGRALRRQMMRPRPSIADGGAPAAKPVPAKPLGATGAAPGPQEATEPEPVHAGAGAGRAHSAP
ncbi:acyltransferase family protein [Allostreptomyces psammosilenae]|uniref:Peptidoglycan/LPS O-acetylase OafA/YrhL n=1 Tax=Allostreptomyces psammosilenae TaxID=1892865 RepID=A0A853A187_9ACTN|nr:acyltransferase [Allostreptomyces psammosilenae]NYI07897.1 peptidoglycan/LPS O-acetylase OafA/YrhL [Allostreptomyces psammosilenae]